MLSKVDIMGFTGIPQHFHLWVALAVEYTASTVRYTCVRLIFLTQPVDYKEYIEDKYSYR